MALDREAVLRNIGGASSNSAAFVLAEIDRWRQTAQSLLAPRVIYRRLPVERIANGTVAMAGGYRFQSAKLSGLFAGAESLVVMVGTIGEALEEESTRLFAANEYMDGLILDAIGSVAVEEVCQHVRSLVCREIGDREGQRVGPSLGPGYQYWDLHDQRVVFGLLPAAEVGVTLTESCLMIPRKSVSAVVPLGRELRVTAGEDEPPCRFCDRQDCPTRIR
ncbi:MAG: hypothetical protein M0Z94_13120 [Dehalococcoidales bacterium]|nr:hypothetical protein [Dehalococcoidales bacterium]